MPYTTWTIGSIQQEHTEQCLFLARVHAACFSCYQFNAMTYMPDGIILARMMTALDLEFEKVLHYHDEGY